MATLRLINLTFSAFLAATIFSAGFAHAQKTDFDRAALKVRDSVVLKSGSTIYGDVRTEDTDEFGGKFVVFETTDGTMMKLYSKMIYRSKVTKVDDVGRQYNQFISTIADEPDAHWELVDWLESQSGGKVRFKNQIQFHLERIAELDPNDDKAKVKLGFVKIESQNRWVPELQYNDALGYVKDGTSWAPKRQSRLSAQSEVNESIEGDRKQAFRRWEKEADRKNPNLAALRTELFKFCDEPAVPNIFAAARKENDPLKRAMFIDAIGRVSNTTAQNALCVFAVEEHVVANRERAMALLSQEHYNKAGTVGFLSQYLRPGKEGISMPSPIIQRAAIAIGDLGPEQAFFPLVGALVTKHMLSAGEQPGRMKQSFGNDGSIQQFGVGEDTAPVIRSFQNKEVLDALKKFADVDYGYDAEAWKRWYIKNHTSYDVKVRR